MANTNTNPYARYAYSPYNSAQLGTAAAGQVAATSGPKPVFTGGDMSSYINNIAVDNLESCTWSISVEVVGNYVMGKRDAVVYTTGKRVIVGTLVFSQYDRHAFLQEVFSLNNNTTYSNLWGQQGGTVASTAGAQTSPTVTYGYVTPASGVFGLAGYTGSAAANGTSNTLSSSNYLGLAGVSANQFNALLAQQIETTSQIVGATKVLYSDQIPPFDLTLIGVTKNGDVSKASIFGIQVTQETAGFSSSDMSNAVGLSFVALAVSPWSPVASTGSGQLTIPPSI